MEFNMYFVYFSGSVKVNNLDWGDKSHITMIIRGLSDNKFSVIFYKLNDDGTKMSKKELETIMPQLKRPQDKYLAMDAAKSNVSELLFFITLNFN